MTESSGTGKREVSITREYEDQIGMPWNALFSKALLKLPQDIQLMFCVQLNLVGRCKTKLGYL